MRDGVQHTQCRCEAKLAHVVMERICILLIHTCLDVVLNCLLASKSACNSKLLKLLRAVVEAVLIL